MSSFFSSLRWAVRLRKLEKSGGVPGFLSGNDVVIDEALGASENISIILLVSGEEELALENGEDGFPETCKRI